VDNDTIYCLHLDLKRELEGTESKLEKSLDLINHGEMFDKESRYDFYNGVRNILNKTVSSFAKSLKSKIKEYLNILGHSIGLQRSFDSRKHQENFQHSPDNGSSQMRPKNNQYDDLN
jgi:hypothetical protein